MSYENIFFSIYLWMHIITPFMHECSDKTHMIGCERVKVCVGWSKLTCSGSWIVTRKLGPSLFSTFQCLPHRGE
jgi:hypothetical protein